MSTPTETTDLKFLAARTASGQPAKLIPLHSISSREEIERRAKMFLERDGQPSGRERDDGREAEAQFGKSL